MAIAKRKRLSREESREVTEQRLVEAALRLIARRGLDATSVEDIAEAAGYSRGAFYSNFKSKNDLFFEVLRRDQERNNARFADALDDSLPLEQIQGHIKEINAALFSDTDSFMAWTEARILSARDPKFRARVADLIAQRRDFVVTVLEYLCRRTGATPSVPTGNLAMGFISLSEGVRLFGASCPNEMTPEIARSILDVFVDAVLQHVMQPRRATQSDKRESAAARGSARSAAASR
jgi:AcrR family transcriptional regulator